MNEQMDAVHSTRVDIVWVMLAFLNWTLALKQYETIWKHTMPKDHRIELVEILKNHCQPWCFARLRRHFVAVENSEKSSLYRNLKKNLTILRFCPTFLVLLPFMKIAFTFYTCISLEKVR